MLGGFPVIYGIDPHNEESVPSHQLGSIGVTPDGREFRYAKAGASLTAGDLLQAEAEDTGEESLAMTAAAIGATEITTSDTVTVVANEYADGYVVATGEGGTGNGYIYKIKSHPAATSAALTLKLYEPLKVAFNTSTQIDIVPNPYANVIQNPASASSAPVGVATIAHTSGYYGWIQTKGAGLVKADASGAVTVGAQLTASNQTAGCVEDGDSDSQAVIGVALTGIAAGEYGAANLNI